MSASAFTIDTYALITTLKEAGFTEKQADVIAKIQGKAASATVEQVKNDLHLDEIATKRDLRELELRIVTYLSAMQQDMQTTKITNRALLAAPKNVSKCTHLVIRSLLTSQKTCN